MTNKLQTQIGLGAITLIALTTCINLPTLTPVRATAWAGELGQGTNIVATTVITPSTPPTTKIEVVNVIAEVIPSASLSLTGGSWEQAIRDDCKRDGTDPVSCTAQIEGIRLAGIEYNVNPAALTAICLSENCSQAGAHNTTGENSLGPFQYNIFGARHEYTHNGMLWADCAVDFNCSASLTASRIVEQYGQGTDWGSNRPAGWIGKLSLHNGYGYPAWYAGKIEQNGLAAGLRY